MLSDEEKDNVFKISVPIITNEELERFEYSLETDLDKIVNEISNHVSRDREIILLKKVIKKQSKEIEHQKEKRENQKQELAILNAKQIEFNKLKNTVNSYKGQFKRQQKEIEELKENNKLLQENYSSAHEDINWFCENYISKEVSEQKERKAYIKGTNDTHELCNKKWEDKIKAKIEEYKKQQKEEPDAYLCIKVLQSLLEKE